MKPLIVPASQFNARQYAAFDQQFVFQCADLSRLDTYLTSGRSDVVLQCKDRAKLARPEDDGIPKAPVWGPVVVGEQTAVTEHVDVTQTYRLIPDGFQGRPGFTGTDGTSLDEAPEADRGTLPPPFVGAQLPPLPMSTFIAPNLGKPWPESSGNQRGTIVREPVRQGKLYRVQIVHVPADANEAAIPGLTEVTLDEVAEDMKAGRVATYIRGEIVTPKLRVEL